MKNSRKPINHLDLFSGIGGFSLGLHRAGVYAKWIGYSDIDKNCNQVFKRRFPNAEELGSITDIRAEELPEIDLVTFGFPCQDLSVANINRKGLTGGERSSLFFEATRIIRDKKPKYFICENVRGLFSSNKGQDFIIVLQEFADIGYDVQWELLNTKCEGGLPQNRERIYIVGHLRGESQPQVFPLGKSEFKNNGIQRQYTNTLTARYDGIGQGSYIIEGKQPAQEEVKIADWRSDEGLRIRKNNISPTLTLATPPYVIKYKNKALNETLEQNDLKEDDVKFLYLYNMKAKYICPTLTEPHHNTLRLYDKAKIRRFTPTETCRLQGFPDDWNDCCSDTQRYKQTGNAVSVPVVQAIMERLYER